MRPCWRHRLALLLGLASLAVPQGYAQGLDFTRRIAPFAVLHTDGTPYTHPFLGGLNVPRPQFADLDGDGDPDLVLQEDRRHLIYFENTGTAAAPRFRWRTDTLGHLDVGTWARLADLDGDGDLDVLAEERFGLVRYYRNDGTAQQPAFTLAADRLRDTSGEVLFSDPQNLPALTDVDCNDRPDLFFGRNDGSLSRYEQDGLDADGWPAFRFVEDNYQGILIVSGSGKRTTGGQAMGSVVRHGANAVTFADLDGDGAPDLIWGDFFEESLVVFQNTNTCAEPVFTRTFDAFPPPVPLQSSGFNVAAFADLDADGDPDLTVGILGGAASSLDHLTENLYRYDQTAPMAFTPNPTPLLTSLDVGQESLPALADLDGDGDGDLIVGNSLDPQNPVQGTLTFYENTGSATAPAYQATATDLFGLTGAFHLAPAFADLDADGDLDALIGRFNGTMVYYRNDGTAQNPRFTEADARYLNTDVGSNATPALADLDADGDLDLVVGETAGTLSYYRNDGTAQNPSFVPVVEASGNTSYFDIDVGQNSAPTLHDLDADGDLDLIVGSQQEGVHYYRNDGTAQNPDFVRDTAFALAVQPFATPAFADLDGDGDADFMAGGERGGLFYYENTRIDTHFETLPSHRVLRLLQPYPNPFTTHTHLRFLLGRPSPLRLTAYDMLGREVAVLAEGFYPSGLHEVTFPAAHLPAGIYLYVLTTNAGTVTGKVVKGR